MSLYVKSRRLDSNLNIRTQHEGVCVLVSRSDLSLRKITLAMRRDEDVP